MEVKEFAVSELVPYGNNPRIISEDAVEKVAESIKEFGFQVPIVVDKDKVVVAGHTRLKAAQKLGLKKVPCVVADDLTPEQVKAYRLADNKTAEASTWDWMKLDGELEAINGIMMNGFGFPEVEEDTGGIAGGEQEINDGAELSTGDFGDKEFELTCPECGFKFNEKK